MYQASIRNTKKHKVFNNEKRDNYILNQEYEEYAYVKKLLGNCRVLLLTNSGNEVIGIIRGSLRKFSKRVIIEVGDIIVISKRDFQDTKVDIVHKYNSDQTNALFTDNKISKTICELYHHTPNSTTPDDDNSNKNVEYNYIDFGNISDISSDSETDSNENDENDENNI